MAQAVPVDELVRSALVALAAAVPPLDLLAPAAVAPAAPVTPTASVDLGSGTGQASWPNLLFVVPPKSLLLPTGPIPREFMPPPVKTSGEVAVEAARGKLGSDYNMGSTGPDVFDCSGLVQWSYDQAGVELPRTSYDQLTAGVPVSRDDLRPGDLVSFYGGGHSALYAGDGKVIHASTYGVGVTESDLDSMPFSGARRF
ncbi:C40 family peptidase [Nocardia bovistercoris]|uniref:C40 family peptidase n=1 Tax=Nocardia bovistercoris TaxID=2785916 RepID=UPI0038CD0ED6